MSYVWATHAGKYKVAKKNQQLQQPPQVFTSFVPHTLGYRTVLPLQRHQRRGSPPSCHPVRVLSRPLPVAAYEKAETATSKRLTQSQGSFLRQRIRLSPTLAEVLATVVLFAQVKHLLRMRCIIGRNFAQKLRSEKACAWFVSFLCQSANPHLQRGSPPNCVEGVLMVFDHVCSRVQRHLGTYSALEASCFPTSFDACPTRDGDTPSSAVLWRKRHGGIFPSGISWQEKNEEM